MGFGLPTLPKLPSMSQFTPKKKPKPGGVLTPQYYSSQYVSSTAELYIRICTYNNSDSVDLENSLTLTKATFSYNINKSINSAGSFSINIKNTINIHSILEVGDWIIIYTGNSVEPKIKQGLRTVGMVERIAKQKTIDGNGNVSTYWNICGSGFGKVLENTSVYITPFKNEKTTNGIDTLGLLKKVQDSLQAGSPDEWVKGVIDFILSGRTEDNKNYYNQTIPASLKNIFKADKKLVHSMISWQFESTKGVANIITPKFNNPLKLQDLVTQYSNLPFNEIIFDIYDGKPTFTFRPCILTKDDLYTLAQSDSIVLDDRFITHKDIGLSSHEVYNYIYFNVTNGVSEIASLHYALKDEFPSDISSIEKYGFRPFNCMIQYCQIRGEDKDVNFDNTILSEFYDLGKDYFFNKRRLLNGTIVLHTFNNFSLGQFVEISSNAQYLEQDLQNDMIGQDTKTLLLKIEDISEEWTMGQPIKITLKVSHGITGDGKYYDEVIAEDDDSTGTTFIDKPNHVIETLTAKEDDGGLIGAVLSRFKL